MSIGLNNNAQQRLLQQQTQQGMQQNKIAATSKQNQSINQAETNLTTSQTAQTSLSSQVSINSAIKSFSSGAMTITAFNKTLLSNNVDFTTRINNGNQEYKYTISGYKSFTIRTNDPKPLTNDNPNIDPRTLSGGKNNRITIPFYNIYTLETLKNKYQLTDEIINEYFKEAFLPARLGEEMKSLGYTLKPDSGFKTVEELVEHYQKTNGDDYNYWQQWLVLGNFMNDKNRTSDDKNSIASTDDNTAITLFNYQEYIEEIAAMNLKRLGYNGDYCSGNLSLDVDMAKIQQEALNKFIVDFSSGNLAFEQAELILNAIGVESLKTSENNGMCTVSFIFNDKKYSISCNAEAAAKGSDDVVAHQYSAEFLQMAFDAIPHLAKMYDFTPSIVVSVGKFASDGNFVSDRDSTSVCYYNCSNPEIIAMLDMLQATGSNGEIDELVQQGKTGDCWLLTGILALNSSEEGKQIIKDSIKMGGDVTETVDENGVTHYEINPYIAITFKGLNLTYEITPEELEQYAQEGQYSTGDRDMLAMEIAVKKLKEDIESGKVQIPTNAIIEGYSGGGMDAGYAQQMLYFLTGAMSETLIADDLSKGLSANEVKDFINEAVKDNGNEVKDFINEAVKDNGNEVVLSKTNVITCKYTYDIGKGETSSTIREFTESEYNNLCELYGSIENYFMAIGYSTGKAAIIDQEEVVNSRDAVNTLTFGLYSGEHSAKCTDGSTFSINIGNGPGHSFAIISYSDTEVTFVDPMDSSKTYTMTLEEFAKLGIGMISVADVNISATELFKSQQELDQATIMQNQLNIICEQFGVTELEAAEIVVNMQTASLATEMGVDANELMSIPNDLEEMFGLDGEYQATIEFWQNQENVTDFFVKLFSSDLKFTAENLEALYKEFVGVDEMSIADLIMFESLVSTILDSCGVNDENYGEEFFKNNANKSIKDVLNLEMKTVMTSGVQLIDRDDKAGMRKAFISSVAGKFITTLSLLPGIGTGAALIMNLAVIATEAGIDCAMGKMDMDNFITYLGQAVLSCLLAVIPGGRYIQRLFKGKIDKFLANYLNDLAGWIVSSIAGCFEYKSGDVDNNHKTNESSNSSTNTNTNTTHVYTTKDGGKITVDDKDPTNITYDRPTYSGTNAKGDRISVDMFATKILNKDGETEYVASVGWTVTSSRSARGKKVTYYNPDGTEKAVKNNETGLIYITDSNMPEISGIDITNFDVSDLEMKTLSQEDLLKKAIESGASVRVMHNDGSSTYYKDGKISMHITSHLSYYYDTDGDGELDCFLTPFDAEACGSTNLIVLDNFFTNGFEVGSECTDVEGMIDYWLQNGGSVISCTIGEDGTYNYTINTGESESNMTVSNPNRNNSGTGDVFGDSERYYANQNYYNNLAFQYLGIVATGSDDLSWAVWILDMMHEEALKKAAFEEQQAATKGPLMSDDVEELTCGVTIHGTPGTEVDEDILIYLNRPELFAQGLYGLGKKDSSLLDDSVRDALGR